MKAVAVLFIALLVLAPAVLAKGTSFYQNYDRGLTITRYTNVNLTVNTKSVPARTSYYTPLSGISTGLKPTNVSPASGQIGLFGKPWLRSQDTSKYLPSWYKPVGGIANTTPGVSKAPCADFGCKPSQYVVGDTSTKKYYRCWCDGAKKIKPENRKCFDDPGIVTRLGFTPGPC